MSSPAYTPTTFNQGAPPQVSAAELNKLGAGIRDARIMPAYDGTSPNPDDTNRVIWKKAAGGAMVAYSQASDAGVLEHVGRPAAAAGSSAVVVKAEAHPSDAIQDAYVEIVNVTSASSRKRYINAVVKPDSGAPGTISRTIIDSKSQSDFVQDAPTGRRVRHWGPYSFGVTVTAGASSAFDISVPAELRPISQFTSFFIDLEMVGISTGGFFEQIGIARADVILNAGTASEAFRWWCHQFAGSTGQGTAKFMVRTVG